MINPKNYYSRTFGTADETAKENTAMATTAVKPQASFTTVTPRMAEEILAANTGNRVIRPRKVAQYARDMIGGNWQVNGEAIVIGTDGRLLNGQHRLTACVQSGVAFDTLMVRGVHDEAFVTMDTGAKRTLGDALRSRGMTTASERAAALNLAVRWDDHVLQDPTIRPTIAEALDWLDNHPFFFDRWTAGTKIIRPSVRNAFDYFVRSDDDFAANADVLDGFWTHVNNGVGLNENDARYALRRYIMGRRSRKLRGEQSLPQVTEAALLVKAWNGYVQHATARTLVWKPNERFPALLSADGSTVLMESF